MHEDLLTAVQLAARLGVSRSTVDRLGAAGKLPVRYIGSRPRYWWPDVEAALRRGALAWAAPGPLQRLGVGR